MVSLGKWDWTDGTRVPVSYREVAAANGIGTGADGGKRYLKAQIWGRKGARCEPGLVEDGWLLVTTCDDDPRKVVFERTAKWHSYQRLKPVAGVDMRPDNLHNGDPRGASTAAKADPGIKLTPFPVDADCRGTDATVERAAPVADAALAGGDSDGTGEARARPALDGAGAAESVPTGDAQRAPLRADALQVLGADHIDSPANVQAGVFLGACRGDFWLLELRDGKVAARRTPGLEPRGEWTEAHERLLQCFQGELALVLEQERADAKAQAEVRATNDVRRSASAPTSPELLREVRSLVRSLPGNPDALSSRRYHELLGAVFQDSDPTQSKYLEHAENVRLGKDDFDADLLLEAVDAGFGGPVGIRGKLYTKALKTGLGRRRVAQRAIATRA